MRFNALVATATAAAFLAACSDNDTTDPELPPDAALTDESLASRDDDGDDRGRGFVFTLSNQSDGNAVLVFARDQNGTLGAPATVPTGGLGSGGGLGNQGALILADRGRWLIAVNPGSNDVSVFRHQNGRLNPTARTPSGGELPISVTEHGGIVYVLNDGGTANITGFRLRHDGSLTPIAGASRPLSIAAPDAAQIQFAPGGRELVVTEKGTNSILVFPVDRHGVAGAPSIQRSHGDTPFGFDFDRLGRLFVSEAFGGATDASALSSYQLRHGSLRLVSGSVGTTETAACWTVITGDGRFAYVTNTGSGSISGYRIGHSGRLRLLDADGQTAVVGAGSSPIDAAITRGSRYLFTLNSGAQSIAGFRIGRDGALESVGTAANLPASTNGLAAW